MIALFLRQNTAIALLTTFFVATSYGAVNQSLIDTFYQNPAELSLVKQAQLLGGDLFIAPKLKFTGSAPGGTGSVTSSVKNNLPYLLSAYRITDRFVLGINITPSGYAHIDWPINSIFSSTSTKTDILYYRSGLQSSYQINDALALGAGVNLETLHLAEVDFVIPGMGNEINKSAGLAYSIDLGLFYKITPKHSLTIAGYTPVSTFGSGTSTLNSTVNHAFRMSITEASVIFVGLQHTLTDKWSLNEKIYWSGWSIQKNLTFENTAAGTSFAVPTNWRDAWSYQVTTRYATTEKIALLGGVMYETNPNPTRTNNVGFPLAASTLISAGLDISFIKTLSTQIVYGYGFLTPNAKINTSKNNGSVSAQVHAATLQFIYKT